MADFLNRCDEAREWIKSYDDFLLIHHYDADGLSAGATVSAGLEKMGKSYERHCFRKLSEREIDFIANSSKKNVILTDLGSGKAEELEGLDKNILIIDHHQGVENSLLQVNPRYHGIDGSREMSASSAAFFVMGFPELAAMASVGSVGDMQYPFIGWNRKMLEIGEGAGVMRAYSDLSMFGRVSRPLITFISTSLDPYFPGLTGHDDQVAKFFDSLGIPLKSGDQWRTYYDLNDDEKMRLRSALVIHLCDYGRCASTKRLISEVYELLNYPRNTEMQDAKEFSTLLNATGRHDMPDLGVNALLQKPGAYDEAHKLLEYHRRILREGIDFALRHVVDLGIFYFVDARGVVPASVVGIIAGMLYGNLDMSKPVMAIAEDPEGNLKVSTRGNQRLIEMGLNLGKALHIVCEEGGLGIGGGHDVAAGATIKPEYLNRFLLGMGDQIYAQIH